MTYIVSSLITADRLPELDVLGSQSLDFSSRIDNAGPGRACTNIDADVVLEMSVRDDAFVN